MKSTFKKTKITLATLSFFAAIAHATPNEPTDEILDWLFQQEQQQQKAPEPCQNYPRCYEPPPFAPEPTETEDEGSRS